MSDRPVLLSLSMICDYSSVCELTDSEPLHLSILFWTVEYNEAEYSVFPLKSILNNTPGVLLQFHVYHSQGLTAVQHIKCHLLHLFLLSLLSEPDVFCTHAGCRDTHVNATEFELLLVWS